MGESSKFPKSWTFETRKNFKFKWSILFRETEYKSDPIQHFEADFLWKDSLKILNSAIILKTFTKFPKSYTFETRNNFGFKWSIVFRQTEYKSERTYYNFPDSEFWGWLSKKSQPQNPVHFQHADRPEQKVQSQIRLIGVYSCVQQVVALTRQHMICTG